MKGEVERILHNCNDYLVYKYEKFEYEIIYYYYYQCSICGRWFKSKSVLF